MLAGGEVELRVGDHVIKRAADDPERDRPHRHVQHVLTVPAARLPAPPRPPDRDHDPGEMHSAYARIGAGLSSVPHRLGRAGQIRHQHHRFSLLHSLPAGARVHHSAARSRPALVPVVAIVVEHRVWLAYTAQIPQTLLEVRPSRGTNQLMSFDRRFTVSVTHLVTGLPPVAGRARYGCAVSALDARAILRAILAAATAAILAGCGSPVSLRSDIASATTVHGAAPAASPAPQTAAPDARPPPPTPRTEPPHPQVGIAYPFDLLTHCGITATRFGAHDWLTVTPSPDPPARRGPDGSTPPQGSPYTPGTMTLIRTDLLRFTYDGGIAEFIPVSPSARPHTACF